MIIIVMSNINNVEYITARMKVLKEEMDDLQMQLDFEKEKVVPEKLEEWDGQFMWSPKTKFLYDYDGEKVGVVTDVNDAIIEFF